MVVPPSALNPRPAESTFDEHCIVELLGHRKLAGRVREVQLAGAGFLRLDIPATPGHGPETQYIAPGSVYALHPTTEAIATAAAGNFRPQPVSRWELERAKTIEPDEDDDEEPRTRIEDQLFDPDDECEDPDDERSRTSTGEDARLLTNQ